MTLLFLSVSDVRCPLCLYFHKLWAIVKWPHFTTINSTAYIKNTHAGPASPWKKHSWLWHSSWPTSSHTAPDSINPDLGGKLKAALERLGVGSWKNDLSTFRVPPVLNHLRFGLCACEVCEHIERRGNKEEKTRFLLSVRLHGPLQVQRALLWESPRIVTGIWLALGKKQRSTLNGLKVHSVILLEHNSQSNYHPSFLCSLSNVFIVHYDCFPFTEPWVDCCGMLW